MRNSKWPVIQTLICVSAFGVMTQGYAQSVSPGVEQTYVGVGVHAFDYQDETLSDVSLNALRIHAGVLLNENLGIEAQYGVGLNDERVQDAGVPSTVEVDHFHGIYLKPILPINDQLSAYGLVGYAEATILKKPELTSVENRFHEYGMSYGFGAQISLSPYSSVTVEYLKLLDETELEASALGIGFNIAL